jgi:hypothetical protein
MSRKPKHPPREVPCLPPRKRLSVLTPKSPIPQWRPLDASIPDINEQDGPLQSGRRNASATPR